MVEKHHYKALYFRVAKTFVLATLNQHQEHKKAAKKRSCPNSSKKVAYSYQRLLNQKKDTIHFRVRKNTEKLFVMAFKKRCRVSGRAPFVAS